MSALGHLIAGHLVHLVLLAPAIVFGVGVWVFARRRPSWDPPPVTAAPATAGKRLQDLSSPGDTVVEAGSPFGHPLDVGPPDHRSRG